MNDGVWCSSERARVRAAHEECHDSVAILTLLRRARRRDGKARHGDHGGGIVEASVAACAGEAGGADVGDVGAKTVRELRMVKGW